MSSSAKETGIVKALKLNGRQDQLPEERGELREINGTLYSANTTQDSGGSFAMRCILCHGNHCSTSIIHGQCSEYDYSKFMRSRVVVVVVVGKVESLGISIREPENQDPAT